MRSMTSRQRGEHCGEECRDDRRANRVRAAVGVLGHGSKVQRGEAQYI
jgi:hypothetical protein